MLFLFFIFLQNSRIFVDYKEEPLFIKMPYRNIM